MKHCIVVPTAGTVSDKPDTPDYIGQMRLMKAFRLAARDPNAPIFIVGGYSEIMPDSTLLSLADKYVSWAAQEYPTYAHRTYAVGDRTMNNTVKDFLGAASSIRSLLGANETEPIEAYFPAHPKHAEQVKPTFLYEGFTLIPEPSGEPAAYGTVVYAILILTTRVDPTWSGPVGKRLNQKSNRMAEAYVSSCKVIRDAIPR